MAYGNFRSVAVEDNGPRRKKPEEEVSLESIVETTPYEQRQQEIKQGINTAAPVNYSTPTPVQETADEEEEEQQRRDRAKERITAQRNADELAAQQDAQNNAWRNIVENASPQDLTSNGQSIWNKQTGQQYSAPNYSQQTQQEQPTSSYMPYGDPRKNKVTVPEPEEEEQPTAGNMVVPSTATTKTAAELEPQWGIVPQSRDYNEDEISQMQRDRSNLVVPRNYNQQENNKDNTAEVPAASDNAELLEQWQKLIAGQAEPEGPVDTSWKSPVDLGSALGGGFMNPLQYGVAQSMNDFNNGVPVATNPNSFGGIINNAIASSTEQQQPFTDQVLVTLGNRNTQGSQTDRQAAKEWADAYAASKRAGYDYTPPEPTPTIWDMINEGIAESTEQQAPFTDQVLETYGNRNEQGYQTPRQEAEDWANAYAASKRAGYEYTPPAESPVESTIESTPAEQRTEENYGTTPERARALEIAQSMGLFGPEAVEEADRILSTGLYNFKPNESAIRTKAENIYLDNLVSDEDWFNMTEAEKNAAKQEAKAYADDVVNNYRDGTPGNQRFDARQGTRETNAEKAARLAKMSEDLFGNPDANKTKAQRLEQQNQELLGTNGTVIPNTGGTNTLNNNLDTIMNGGGSLEDLIANASPDAKEAIRQGQAINALDALGDLTIPKGVDAYMATDRWTSAGNLGTLIYGANGLTATANPQNVETINATQDEMIAAVKALVDANPELQKLIDSGQVDYTDIIRRYFKATPEMVSGADNFVDNVQNGGGDSYKKGYTYSTPSYKQDMERVVKAPYKQGGYTAEELQAMGNKPYKGANGYDQYEGYYYWNGAWYPVDQEKAAYYLKNGTYEGWDEGMRDYYNTFGTFKGYTPNWKTSSYNRSSGGNSYSYSGGGSGSGYNPYNYNTPQTTLQQAQRINNIMKNWTF